MSSIKWLPLESNPDVMNKCLINLGVPEKWGVTDILSMDDELLHMTPLPSLAVLLLFPISPKYIEYCEQQEERMKNTKADLKKIYYMKQTIRNACGTIALVHALANNEGILDLPQDSVLKKFLDSTRNLSPEEKGEFLEKNMEISAVHEESAQQGQTEAPDLDDDCNQHYIAITSVDGYLVELDGRKNSPIVHGHTNEDSFLRDALRICKEYMERDPENLNFSAMSFGAMN